MENRSDSGLSCPRLISFYFQLVFNWKSIRFWPELPQNISISFSIRFWLKINQILAWAAPDESPFIFNYILIANPWDSGLSCARPISFNFQLDFNWKSIRFWPELPQTTFLSISIRILLKIHQILAWAAQTNFLLFSIRFASAVARR